MDKNLAMWGLNFITSNFLVASLFMIIFPIYLFLGIVTNHFNIENDSLYIEIIITCFIVGNIFILTLYKKKTKLISELEKKYAAINSKDQSVKYGRIICWSIITFMAVSLFSIAFLFSNN